MKVIIYDVIEPFYPLIRRMAPRYVTTTVSIGRAMIEVAGMRLSIVRRVSQGMTTKGVANE